MTNNTHTIAAILASQTPIGTRYALVAVPGTELTNAECPLCAGPHTLTQCAEWAGGPRLIEGLRAENAALRLALDDAHQHVGALVGAIARERAAHDAYMRCTDDEDMVTWSTLADEYQDACASTIIAENAARAWLRRRGD